MFQFIIWATFNVMDALTRMIVVKEALLSLSNVCFVFSCPSCMLIINPELELLRSIQIKYIMRTCFAEKETSPTH